MCEVEHYPHCIISSDIQGWYFNFDFDLEDQGNMILI
jgi:hypothetical protein